MPVNIFFCYAHEDEELLNKLKSHLKPLQREGIINIWHDRDISAGAEWEHEINKYLIKAQVILLLVSPDFLNSDYCYSVEMKRAIERHKRGMACVIPIILRPVYWRGEPLGKLQALPTDAKPVTSWHDIDEAFLNVTEGVRKLIEHLAVVLPVDQSAISQKASEKSVTEPFITFGEGGNQQNTFARTGSLLQTPLKNSSFLSSSLSVFYRQGKLAMQGKKIILVLSIFDILFLLGSFFFSPDSPISLVAILVGVGVFIFALIESALLQQWYWFVAITLFNPLTGFLYYETYTYSISLIVKWDWFIGSTLLSSFVGAVYSLFGPKEKSCLPVTQMAFRQLILTNSSIGIAICIIANTLPALWAVYVGLDFYMVGYVLAIIQVFRLKHVNWVEERIPCITLVLPVFLFAILYAIFSPKVEED